MKRLIVPASLLCACLGGGTRAPVAIADCYDFTLAGPPDQHSAAGSFTVQYADDVTFSGALRVDFPHPSADVKVEPEVTARGMFKGFVVNGLVHLTLFPGERDDASVWPTLMVEGFIRDDRSIDGMATGIDYTDAVFEATPAVSCP